MLHRPWDEAFSVEEIRGNIQKLSDTDMRLRACRTLHDRARNNIRKASPRWRVRFNPKQHDKARYFAPRMSTMA